MKNSYDVIVIGGGHAGIEASNAVSKMGGKIALFNFSIDTIGVMSCNPAIGGLAKGHLVREIDALGGVMGKAIDKTGIQFRMLNMTKGPAVWGPRAQADKEEYRKFVTEYVSGQENIDVYGEPVDSLIFENNKYTGVVTETGKTIKSKAVIITTGTFLNGTTFVGKQKKSEGRYGERPSIKLGNNLKTLDISIGRLKTGTPCRIHKDSIDYGKMTEQPGDVVPMPFSFDTENLNLNQVCCYLTHTTPLTKQIVQENLHLSALYGGEITGIGPRYCPSIEDKFVKFKDKERHLLFVEPEGLTIPSMYINGASSSLPADIQIKMIRSIEGLENAEILRTGYAIEYDFVDPRELTQGLEIKKYPNIFLAGQINGTSGYEEAAAQGLMAGINAMLKINNKEPLVLKRSEAYIGVLIDDLVTKGVDEPYRMFTSRADHRLLLRQDTADFRLMEYGYKLGTISEYSYKRMRERKERILKTIKIMDETIVKGKSLSAHYIIPYVAEEEIISMKPDIFADLRGFEKITVLADIKYRGYLEKENERIQKSSEIDEKIIPPAIDYKNIKSMRIEAKEKFNKIRPRTIGQAKNIPGISPSDIQLLVLTIERRRHYSES